jgi:hypothetical protein
MPPWPRTLLEVPLLPRYNPPWPWTVEAKRLLRGCCLFASQRVAGELRRPSRAARSWFHTYRARGPTITYARRRHAPASVLLPPARRRCGHEIRLDWGYAISIRPALLHLLNKCSGVKKINYGGLFCLALCLQCAILPFLMPISMDR